MWPYPPLVAHRGGGSAAPENTMAGLRAAAQAGCRAVEFDVMLAADRVPVLMHDEELGRTVRGTGRVPDYPSSALAGMDAGSWMSPRFAGEPVPTYVRALEFCSANGLWMNVEIKPAAGYEWETGQETARLALEVLGDSAGSRVLFSSFSVLSLQAARDAAPAVPRGLLVEDLPPDWRAQMVTLSAVSLHVNYRRLARADIGRIHEAGYGVFCYTVNSAAALRSLFAAGVDAVCTDRLELAGQAR